MKIEFVDGDSRIELSIKPENMADVARLYRLSNNMKKIKPEIFFSLSSNEPWAIITIKKVRPEIQQTCISK